MMKTSSAVQSSRSRRRRLLNPLDPSSRVKWGCTALERFGSPHLVRRKTLYGPKERGQKRGRTRKRDGTRRAPSQNVQGLLRRMVILMVRNVV